jgi:hypothetical protein
MKIQVSTYDVRSRFISIRFPIVFLHTSTYFAVVAIERIGTFVAVLKWCGVLSHAAWVPKAPNPAHNRICAILWGATNPVPDVTDAILSQRIPANIKTPQQNVAIIVNTRKFIVKIA